jgi:hypothetical protein
MESSAITAFNWYEFFGLNQLKLDDREIQARRVTYKHARTGIDTDTNKNLKTRAQTTDQTRTKYRNANTARLRISKQSN